MIDNTNEIDKETISKPKKRNFYVDLLIRLFKEKPLGTFGFVLVLIFLMAGIFANYIAPFGMNEVHPLDMLLRPSGQYLLGTDNLGRDVLSNVIYGARISVIIGLSASALMTVLCVALGAASALIGGIFDLLFQRFVDAWLSIPGLLILLTLVSITGRGMIQVILIIAIPGSIGGSRIIRSAVMAIKENVYVEAAYSIGSTPWRIFTRHILPHIMPVVIILFTMGVGDAIMMEAGLSFLGFGVPPGVPSWGNMLSQEGRQFALKAPWIALWPGVALSLTIFGVNMFGDAIRDLLDPRIKGKEGRFGVSHKIVNKILRSQRKSTGDV